MERKLRIYIDSSVIGGCYDDEFKEWSNQLIDEFRSVNIKEGYKTIEIYSPREVISYGV